MRRGLTLIELLASTALLTLIAVAAMGWMQSAARLSSAHGGASVWHGAANAAYRAILHDLRTGDVGGDKDAMGIEIVSSALRIELRGVDGRPIVHEYRLERASGELVRAERDGTARRNARALLGEVRQVTFDLSDDQRRLFITIDATHDESINREVLLW